MLVSIVFECDPLSSGYQGLEEEVIVRAQGLGAGAMLLYYTIIVRTTSEYCSIDLG